MSIKRINEFPEGSGSLSNDDIFLFMDDPSGAGVTKKISLSQISSAIGGGGGSTFDAAVPWTANHTLVDGTRYLANDLVYSSGNLYRAKFDNESIPVTDTTYWENVGPGYRLNIDGRDIPNIPNPFDQNLNTTDFPTFSGVNLNNNSSLAQGTYDNGTSGNGGISLNCTVGYELNWQGGHLKCTQDGGITSSNIILDSPLQFSDNVMICSTSDDLLLKYAAAKLLTPNGNSLSSTNRATLIIMPGVYPLTGQWEIDGEFVDIIGLGSSSLDRGCNVAVTVTDYDINVSANDVKLKGIGTAPDHALKVDGDKPLQVFEECKGGDSSFGGLGTASGTFTNCSGGYYSFGGGGTASGTFTNCSGGPNSFGGVGTASGTFTNCSGGHYSLGGYGTASGTFTNCSGGDYSFGGVGTASGIFTNCSGGNYSFGGNGGNASGTFLRCTSSGAFPSLTYPGIQRLCIDGSYNVINSDAPTP